MEKNKQQHHPMEENQAARPNRNERKEGSTTQQGRLGTRPRPKEGKAAPRQRRGELQHHTKKQETKQHRTKQSLQSGVIFCVFHFLVFLCLFFFFLIFLILGEVRKVLARMLFKVLDEVCQHEPHGVCHAQQAFVTGHHTQFLGRSRRGCSG